MIAYQRQEFKLNVTRRIERQDDELVVDSMDSILKAEISSLPLPKLETLIKPMTIDDVRLPGDHIKDCCLRSILTTYSPSELTMQQCYTVDSSCSEKIQ